MVGADTTLLAAAHGAGQFESDALTERQVGAVPIHVFASVQAKTPQNSRTASPVRIAALLREKVLQVPRKEAAPLVTFNKYRDGATGRGTADIELAHAVCGDIDGDFDGAKFEAGLAELERCGAQVVSYQTFNHSPEAPRWRVLVFLDEPVSSADYRRCWHGLNDIFSGMLDGNAKDCARLNYWPSCPPGQSREVRTLNVGGIQ